MQFSVCLILTACRWCSVILFLNECLYQVDSQSQCLGPKAVGFMKAVFWIVSQSKHRSQQQSSSFSSVLGVFYWKWCQRKCLWYKLPVIKSWWMKSHNCGVIDSLLKLLSGCRLSHVWGSWKKNLLQLTHGMHTNALMMDALSPAGKALHLFSRPPAAPRELLDPRPRLRTKHCQYRDVTCLVGIETD